MVLGIAGRCCAGWWAVGVELLVCILEARRCQMLLVCTAQPGLGAWMCWVPSARPDAELLVLGGGRWSDLAADMLTEKKCFPDSI